MLVLTIQDKSVLQMIGDGKYKADFWKCKFSCLSPKFTKGYMVLKSELLRATGKTCDSPIFAWGGTPFIDSIKGSGDKKALFLEVPENELIFSDYDKFCDFVYGTTETVDFILPKKKAKEKIKRGYCVQVCMPYIKPEWVLSSVDFSLIDKFEGTVDDCYRYCNLLKSYFLLSE